MGVWQQWKKRGGGGGWGGGWKAKKKSFIIHAQTVWVGNLPANTTYEDLLAHGQGMGSATWAEVHKYNKKEGAIGFATKEDAKAAIALLNGSFLKGAKIKCDAYKKKK